MHSAWYTAEINKCQVCLWCQKCHHFHLRYNLNRCIAQLSSCSGSTVQQGGLAQKDLPVVVSVTMALIATRDFQRVSSKKMGEIINSCIDGLQIKAHTLRETCLRISSEKVCLRIVSNTVEALSYCSYMYLALIKARY